MSSPARIAAGALLLVVVGGVVALTLLSRSPDHLADQAGAALDRHDLAGAEQGYRQALAQDPGHLPSLVGIGWTYMLAGQGGAAEKAFEHCLELQPETAECIRGLAATASARGDRARARTLLDRAVGLAPDDPKVLSSVALLELAEGDLDAAGSLFESLVARFPEQAEYATGLAEVRLQQGREEEALPLIEEALALPATPRRHQARLRVLHARVLVASVAGRISPAVEDPTRCEELAPPLLAWLDAADAEVDRAEGLGVPLPTIGHARRLVARNRGVIEEACPGIGLAPLTEGMPRAE